MTKFIDGPLANRTLMLKRSPVFLRATMTAAGTVDALDQPTDTPSKDERLFAYVIHKNLGTSHINRGRNGSGFYPISEYRLFVMQPLDAIMRDSARWQAWCDLQPPPAV